MSPPGAGILFKEKTVEITKKKKKKKPSSHAVFIQKYVIETFCVESLRKLAAASMADPCSASNAAIQSQNLFYFFNFLIFFFLHLGEGSSSIRHAFSSMLVHLPLVPA